MLLHVDFFKVIITSNIIQTTRLYIEIHEYVYTYTNAYNNNEKEIVNLNESKKKCMGEFGGKKMKRKMM